MCGEVPQERSFVRQAHAGNLVAVLPNLENHFHDVVDVALGVDAAGDCETNEVHLRGTSEHQCADFYGTNSAFKIQFSSQSHTGKLVGGNMRQEGTGVEIDRMSTGRLNDRDTLARDVIAEIRSRGNTVAQIIFFESFLHTDGDRFEVTTREAAIGGSALGQN